MAENQTVIDKKLIVWDETINKVSEKTTRLRLHTQTETVIEVPIADPFEENKNILVHKQEKITDIYIVGT